MGSGMLCVLADAMQRRVPAEDGRSDATELLKSHPFGREVGEPFFFECPPETFGTSRALPC